MLVGYGVVPGMDTEYECPCCGNQNVTYFRPGRRYPRTLKCGVCDCRFDWRTGEITGYSVREDDGYDW